jgi:hypothetical protein
VDAMLAFLTSHPKFESFMYSKYLELLGTGQLEIKDKDIKDLYEKIIKGD